VPSRGEEVTVKYYAVLVCTISSISGRTNLSTDPCFIFGESDQFLLWRGKKKI